MINNTISMWNGGLTQGVHSFTFDVKVFAVEFGMKTLSEYGVSGLIKIFVSGFKSELP